jgi:hypothetical protein
MRNLPDQRAQYNPSASAGVAPLLARITSPSCCLDGGGSICKRISLTVSNDDEAETMTTFDKREDGFEKQFAHDEELRFKAMARRNKLLGLWAAEKLGLTGAEADAYAKEVVIADFEEAGDGDVFRKVRKDFDAKNVAQSDHQIRRTMDELLAQAVAQIKSGNK